MLHRILAGITALCAAASAQTVSGTLAGRVTDSTGAVIPSVTITARNQETDLVRQAPTNHEGYFSFSFVPLGSYELSASIKGFQRVVKKDVIVDLNRTTVSDFVLALSTVEAAIEVSGATPLIETTQGDVKHTLNARQIQDTPLAGRNFISLMEQIPGFGNAPWIGSSNNPTNSTGSYAAFNGTGARS